MFVIPLFLFQNYRVMLDIPSQYMHHCLVLLCEVCCVIVLGLGIIVVFFVTELETCFSLGISCTSQVFDYSNSLFHYSSSALDYNGTHVDVRYWYSKMCPKEAHWFFKQKIRLFQQQKQYL